MSQSKTKFTDHAFMQVYARMHLLQGTIIKLLDRDLTIPVKSEPGTNRVHRLFYSVVDDNYFIAVWDEKTREIITVMPVQFGGYQPPQGILNEAKHLAHRLAGLATGSPAQPPTEKTVVPPAETKIAAPPSSQDVPRTFQVLCYVENQIGVYRLEILAKLSIAQYRGEPGDILRSPEIRAFILRALRKIEMGGEMIRGCIYLRRGNKGEVVPLCEPENLDKP